MKKRAMEDARCAVCTVAHYMTGLREGPINLEEHNQLNRASPVKET